MNIIHAPHHGVNKDQAAQVLGIKTYDCALPQPWVNQFVETLKDTPTAITKGIDYLSGMILSSFVWSYDDAKVFGRPHPLTIAAFGWLRCYDCKKGSHYSDENLNVLDIA
jgi:hypothetical protein